MKKIIGAVFLVIIFIIGIKSEIYASKGVIEKQTKQGCINIQLSEESERKKRGGVIFSYVKVAEWKNGTYENVGNFASTDLNFNQIKTANELEEAAKRVEGLVNKADGNVVTDEEGKAKIENLNIGIYFITSKDNTNNKEIVPFFVTVPTWDSYSKEMLYNIEVIPKYRSIPEKPRKETVQTGDKQGLFYIHWIIVSMSGAILVRCLMGRKEK